MIGRLARLVLTRFMSSQAIIFHPLAGVSTTTCMSFGKTFPNVTIGREGQLCATGSFISRITSRSSRNIVAVVAVIVAGPIVYP